MHNARLRDNKSISVSATFEDFLLLDILLKVGDCINPCDEGTFCRGRRGEQVLMVCGPFTEIFRCSVLNLARDFSRR
jgi:hypothetical protein